MSSVLKNHHIVSSDYLVEKSKSIEKIWILFLDAGFVLLTYMVIRQLSDSHQTATYSQHAAIRQSLDSHQTAIGESIGSHQSFTRKSSETFGINKIATYVFQNTCNIARLQSFLVPKKEM